MCTETTCMIAEVRTHGALYLQPSLYNAHARKHARTQLQTRMQAAHRLYPARQKATTCEAFRGTETDQDSRPCTRMRAYMFAQLLACTRTGTHALRSSAI